MDIEIYNRDRADILAIPPVYPYDQGTQAAYQSIDTIIGFNWSDIGVASPPSGVIKWCCMLNYLGAAQSGFTRSIVGIAFKGTKTMSLSGNALKATVAHVNYVEGYTEEPNATQHNLVREIYSHIVGGVSQGDFTILYMSKNVRDGMTNLPDRAVCYGTDTPFLSNADLSFIQSTYNPRLCIRHAIEDFLYATPNVSFDAWVFSEAVDVTDTDATFKFKRWGNLQNMPAGKLPSDYTVGVMYADHLNPSWTAMFTSKSGVIEKSYSEIYDTLTPNEQNTATTNGYMDVKIVLRHGLTVAQQDAYHIVRLYPDGNMTLIYETSPGQLFVKPFTSPYDNDLYGGDNGILIQQVPGQQMSVDNLLTTSYAMTDSELQQFGSFLWNNNEPATNYKEMQTAPIENVISCKRIPFAVPDVEDNPQQVEVHCGNVRTGVMAYKALSTHKQDIGVITIPAYTHDYMDYENNISIYLPYCGIQMIPTGLCYTRTLVNAKDADGHNITYKNSDDETVTVQVPKVVGRKLGVVYYYDIVYGSCCALLYIDAEWDSVHEVVTDGNLIAVFNGDCGVDIPITASNRAANELSIRKAGDSMIAGAVMGAAGGLVTGGVLGGLLGGALGLGGGYANQHIQQKYQDTHYTTSGGFSSQVASYMSKTVTLFVEHTTYTEDPQDYAHENGYPCNLTLNMKLLKGLGYTELSGEIEISNIDCLEEERRGLKEALTQGFYVSDNTAQAPMIGVVD